ncbi:MAG: CTP--phosphocholine cytidylyltransferase, partial [Solobacterium sp.]|nr:CTP--phosphocholine cytidylyltransferase [Solobacterium sp.]
MSVGSVNRILDEFKTAGLYDGSSITKAGYQALEPYRVKRAVILAAGFGDRLMPITLNTPKPLIRVNGM